MLTISCLSPQKIMSDVILCPQCNSDLTYADQDKMVCTQCFHEWKVEENAAENVVESVPGVKVLDAIGNELANGDTVQMMKDLPIKGYLRPIKVGTKVKNIKLTDSDGDHNISCKIDGFGLIALKSEFVRKV
jgi:protein PhnA